MACDAVAGPEGSSWEGLRHKFLSSCGQDYGYPSVENFDFSKFREAEFPHLRGKTYLDYGGASPYARSQLEASFLALSKDLFTNPHTHTDFSTSVSTADAVRDVRLQVLSLLNADPEEYCCIFTSGATGALKLVAESFPWQPGGRFAYTLENHNSVLGMRELALAGGACAACVEIGEAGEAVAVPPEHSLVSAGGLPDDISRGIHDVNLGAHRVEGLTCIPDHVERAKCRCFGDGPSGSGGDISGCPDDISRGHAGPKSADPNTSEGVRARGPVSRSREVPCLFALPGECNFSGRRMGLEVVHRLQGDAVEVPGSCIRCRRGSDSRMRESVLIGGRERWFVLLDAAKACSTSPPDLAQFPADFVALSFYKIFGYPAGLGALIARKEALKFLRKRYFSGGTVSSSAAASDYFERKNALEEWFEDGTPPFLDIVAALPPGLGLIKRLTFPAILRHAQSLASFTETCLASLRHASGTPACVVYCPRRPLSVEGQQGRAGGGPKAKGPTVTFNLRRADGAWVGHREVAKLAELHGLVLRTGSFCNPGAASKHLGVTLSDRTAFAAKGSTCWDETDLLEGRPMGAVRASFGYASSIDDAIALVQFVCENFVQMDTPLVPHQYVGGCRLGPFEALGAGRCSASGALDGGCSQGAIASARSEMDAERVAVGWARPLANGTDAAESQRVLYLGQNPGGMFEGLPSMEESCNEEQASTTPHGRGANLAKVHPDHAGMQAREQLSRCMPNSQGEGTLMMKNPPQLGGKTLTIEALYVYPIKSCAAMPIQSWPLGETGLFLDREWALLDAAGAPLKSRKHPGMALITPTVDLETGVMIVSSPATPSPLRISLTCESMVRQEGLSLCGDRVSGLRYRRPEVDGWFSQALGVQCRLMRQRSGSRCVKDRQGGAQIGGRADCWDIPTAAAATAPNMDCKSLLPAAPPHLGFANEGQFLVVSSASVADLNWRLKQSHAEALRDKAQGCQREGQDGDISLCQREPSVSRTPLGREERSCLDQGGFPHVHTGGAYVGKSERNRLDPQRHWHQEGPLQVCALRFRPNILVGGADVAPYAEDTWQLLSSGGLKLRSRGGCSRCAMINQDPSTGAGSGLEPLRTLSKYRRKDSKIFFGSLFVSCPNQETSSQRLKVGGSLLIE